MKRHLILSSLILIPFLASCDTSRVSTPNSPFKDDKYVRVGMKSKGDSIHKITEGMTQAEYSEIKDYIDKKDSVDINVVKYQFEQEDRDLKYAYFGKESSTISQCTLTSMFKTLNRYKNRVFIDHSETNKEIQTANGGIQKTKTTLTDYTFDIDYKNPTPNYGQYEKRLETQIDKEKPTVEQEQAPKSYDQREQTIIYTIFGLKPTDRIKNHFLNPDPKDPDPFVLLGNSAVYGKNSEGKYVIREGHSHFIDYSTTMGRTYKAVDNYFYEGLLEKTDNTECPYRFLDFRFYHELLILSKAFSSEGSIPILYLEKPALIEFSETTYSDITYRDEGEANFDYYDKTIPDPTTPQ